MYSKLVIGLWCGGDGGGFGYGSGALNSWWCAIGWLLGVCGKGDLLGEFLIEVWVSGRGWEGECVVV